MSEIFSGAPHMAITTGYGYRKCDDLCRIISLFLTFLPFYARIRLLPCCNTISEKESDLYGFFNNDNRKTEKYSFNRT